MQARQGCEITLKKTNTFLSMIYQLTYVRTKRWAFNKLFKLDGETRAAVVFFLYLILAVGFALLVLITGYPWLFVIFFPVAVLLFFLIEGPYGPQ